jgi:hypothetical protein
MSKLAVPRLLTAVLTAFAAVCLPPLARAADHDGDWTVYVITEQGKCEHSTSLSVRVTHGIVQYAGYTSAVVNGTVSPAGVATVTIRHFEDGATARGRLNGRTGAGDWHGVSRDGPCSGRWQAVRR